jgi:hypothetical protein
MEGGLSFRSDERDMILYKVVTQQAINSMGWQALGTWQRGWQQFSILKNLQSPAWGECAKGSYFKNDPHTK